MKKFLCLLFIMIFSQSTQCIQEQQAQVGGTEYRFSTQIYCPALSLWYGGDNIGTITRDVHSFNLKKGNAFGLAGGVYKYNGTLGDKIDLSIECRPTTKEIIIWQ